jgi:hypothetical protein
MTEYCFVLLASPRSGKAKRSHSGNFIRMRKFKRGAGRVLVCELRAMLNQIPDDAELKFAFEMTYVDNCNIVEYPEKYLNGHPPFYYLETTLGEPKIIKD